MKNNRVSKSWRLPHLIAAILTGVVVGLVIEIALSAALGALGIPTWIDFGRIETVMYGGGSYVVEKQADSAFTITGSALVVISIMLGVRAGRAFYHMRVDGNVSPGGDLLFQAWLFGVVFYGAIGAIQFAIFDRQPGWPGLIHKILQLAAVVITYMIFNRWLTHRRQRLGSSVNGTI